MKSIVSLLELSNLWWLGFVLFVIIFAIGYYLISISTNYNRFEPKEKIGKFLIFFSSFILTFTLMGYIPLLADFFDTVVNSIIYGIAFAIIWFVVHLIVVKIVSIIEFIDGSAPL